MYQISATIIRPVQNLQHKCKSTGRMAPRHHFFCWQTSVLSRFILVVAYTCADDVNTFSSKAITNTRNFVRVHTSHILLKQKKVIFPLVSLFDAEILNV